MGQAGPAGADTLPRVSPVFDSGVALGEAAARRLALLRVCEIGPGLTDAEFARIEGEYEIDFSDDHRAFLASGLPYLCEPQVSDEQAGMYHTWEWPWPDWRNGDPDRLREHVHGLSRWALEDIDQGRVWSSHWGQRPADTAEARRIAREKLAEAPPMIPVYAHRYLPGGSGTFGFPVLSIHQTTDVVIYGGNLDDYIYREFGKPDILQDVPFWSDL
jgi:hypothetical protein